MKTFLNALKVMVVTLLFVSLSVAARDCKSCKPCEPKRACSACPAVKIPGEQVEYQKITKTSCGNPGSVKYKLTKEYIPCDMEDKEHVQTLTGCPKYLGTFDENGNRID